MNLIGKPWSVHLGFLFFFLSVSRLTFAAGHTQIERLFVIVLENVTWPEIRDSTNAPYITQVLLPISSYADQFFTAPKTAGSLPQYLWLEAGTNFGINDSNDPSAHHIASAEHLTVQLDGAGISWKAYQEDIDGTNCPLASRGLYAAYHNPFVYFDDSYLNPVYCSNHIRPYFELERDLTNGTTARYNFITPNLCNDMHNAGGCAHPSRVRNGDDWLAREVPKILASASYRERGAIIITWDEGSGGVAGPFATIILSPWAKGGGYRNTNRFDHASTLRTIQEIFGVGPLLFAAANAPSLNDLFKPAIVLASPILSRNTFRFTVTGISPHQTNLIQSTLDLMTWTNLGTNIVATDSFDFLDDSAGDSPHRFYRLLAFPSP